MNKGYPKAKIFQIGRDNYDILVKYCDILLEEGYWEKAEAVLNRPIEEMLDLYIQAVLVQTAIFCDCYNSEECEYIEKIPRHNMLSINLLDAKKEDINYQSQKILNAPPILLQLLSLRDIEKSSSLAETFFDALLNLLLAMAYLNNSKDRQLTSFILGYFKQINAFFKSKDKSNYNIDERYIFRKISCEDLELCNAFMLTANGDFEHYKDKYIFSRSKVKNLYPACDDEETHKVKESKERETKIKEGIIKGDITEDSTEDSKEGEGKENGDLVRDKKLDALLEELHSLIGLEAVKTEINSLINLIKVRKMREEYQMPTMEMSYHMVYTGNPGTGKTTVARLVARIYKELGLLSEGNLVETDRSGLIAGFVGQTALKVKEVVERAIGGVLFIDEAYSLAGGIGTNDFGGEAIDTLVKLMEDNRDNLVVIVAGYREEMQKFLKANTGLISRFNKFIDFADYTNEELLLILKSMTEKAGLTIEEAALESVYEKLLTMSDKDRMQFGNGRGIRNVFEKIVVNQANRIVTYEKPTKEQLAKIQPDDVFNVL